MARRTLVGSMLAVSTLAALAACDTDQHPVGLAGPTTLAATRSSDADRGDDRLRFTPLATSAACTPGGNPQQPFLLPPEYMQHNIASEPSYDDLPDMNALNASGPRAGRFLYQAHEGGAGSISVIDRSTGVTRTIFRRADWESLDPILWTPRRTLLVAEETNAASRRDPRYPNAVAGLVYEVFVNANDPAVIDSAVARPALGSKAHEGQAFDRQGNFYSISERTPGYIFKFVPDHRGDLSSGQLYALKVTEPTGDRTGGAVWVPLDRAAVQVDASAAADAVGATGYGRPEDLEITGQHGSDHGSVNTLYAAITSEHRVLAIDLNASGDDDRADRGRTGGTAFVYNYVARGLNTTTEFEMPDNLAFDRYGNLFIAEEPGGSSPAKIRGDDIWAAAPAAGTRGLRAPLRQPHRLRRRAHRHHLRPARPIALRERPAPRRRPPRQDDGDRSRRDRPRHGPRPLIHINT